MRAFILALIVILAFSGINFSQTLDSENVFAVNQQIVDQIKKSDLWQPMEVLENPFKGWNIKALRKLCGIIPSIPNKNSSSSYMIAINNNNRTLAYPPFNGTLPVNFDLRKKWPNCIAPVKDQGNCGSCWAFPTADVLGDNRCIIQFKPKEGVQLSQQDLVSCDYNDYGCNGGYLDYAFYYMTTVGISTNSCIPYTSGNGIVPACPASCVNSTEPMIKYQCNQV